MRTISCKLEDLKNMTLHIGYEGENNYTSIRIDAGSVFAQYPEAAASMKVQPPKGNMYPVLLTREDNVVIWNVSDSDTASNGNGEIQLTFTENTVVVKSCKAKTLVHRSLNATGPAPDPLMDFIDRAEEVVQEAENAATEAAEAAEHAPLIGLDGYWYRWDAEAGEYVSTGTKAQGPQGTPGEPGAPGDPTQLIDDTSGEGQTGKTWSADKINTEVSQVKTDITKEEERTDDIEGYLSESIGSDNTVAFNKTVPTGAIRAFVSDIGTKTLTYNQHQPVFNLTNQNGLDYTTDESTGWTTVHGTSSANTGFRPSNSDVIPLGHIGAVLIDTDGITIQTSLSAGFEVYISSGPGYNNGAVKRELTESTLFTTSDYTWGISFRCGTGNAIDGKIRVQIFDLTVMFGSGNEPATLNDFIGIFTGGYYPYDKDGTQITISCDSILLNNETQAETSFAVTGGDVITIHTSTTINNIVMPVASTVTYNGLNYEEKEEAISYQTESEKVTTDLLNESADLRIMLFTDNHDYTPFKYKKYADMMSHGVIDYLVGLGDYKDYSTTHDKIWYKEHLLKALTEAGREGNCLFAIGNHDVGIKGVNGAPNSADYLLSPKECYDVLNRHYSKNPSIVYDADNPTRGYGYYYVDNEAAKVRMIFLNSSDIFQTDGSFIRYKNELMFISQQQLTWFAHIACKLDKDDPSDWTIIVFCHFAFPYGATEYMLFKILEAVKAGSSIEREITVYNRLTLDGDTWTTTVDETNGDTLSVDEDYSSQGAVDVCGIIYGHNHSDETKEYAGINAIMVRCDNGVLDNYYLAPVSNYTAGTYYFTDVSGQMWSYTITSDYPTCAYIGYNKYFTDSSMQTMPISRYDSNKNRIGSNGSVTRVNSAPSGATEITGFVSERGTSRIGQESAEILCIDKVNKTLTFIPYGTASKRTVSY